MNKPAQTQTIYQGLIPSFVYSGGIILSFAAIAKLISSGGNARILQTPDPILGISFRQVFWLVGTIELVIVLICFLGKRRVLQVASLAWLATNFLVYRLGLLWIGNPKPCPCLGNLTDMLHIKPKTADSIMKWILAYLLIGSYASLLWLWKERRKAKDAAALTRYNEVREREPTL